YEKILNTYIKFYKDIEIIALPISADPGAMGGAFSHEFHALSDAGESFVHFDSGLLEYLKSNRFFTIKDLTQFYATLNDKGGDHDDIRYKNSKSIEVGHIFSLGKRYSKAMDFCVQNKDGILQNPEMGCYGIGLSRLVGAIIEINQQKECMRWPRKIAPFVCMISNLNIKDVRCVELTSHCINTLSDLKIDFLCDDTKDSPGRKLVRSDTLGFPLQITIGSRNAQNDEIEIALRNTKFQFTDQILQNQRSKVIKIQELSDFLYENNFVIK
ncbi:MAG: His/Gly/Thr/Pro-type tRNA ligase C-terminal domain-containing protein, partial [Proteobacteria bacterium]|nr:His/Gly/Thr/Pro-type tRNA ligase C-terminal domain-containing protein [Pseudomonadota bacterium]